MSSALIRSKFVRGGAASQIEEILMSKRRRQVSRSVIEEPIMGEKGFGEVSLMLWWVEYGL